MNKKVVPSRGVEPMPACPIQFAVGGDTSPTLYGQRREETFVLLVSITKIATRVAQENCSV